MAAASLWLLFIFIIVCRQSKSHFSISPTLPPSIYKHYDPHHNLYGDMVLFSPLVYDEEADTPVGIFSNQTSNYRHSEICIKHTFARVAACR